MKLSNLNFLLYVLAFQAIVCVSIILDIAFVRQVLGFIFLVFIPGFLIVRTLRIERPHFSETLVLSVGLSLSFLMMIGVGINELGSLNILTSPLATEPLFIAINVIVACLCVVSYFTNKEYIGLYPQDWVKFWKYLPFLLLPLLSLIGVLFVFYFQSNILLIFVIVLITIVFAISILKEKLSSYHPLIIISIVLAILLSSALMSNYVYGDDIQSEFHTFIETKNALSWNPQNYTTVQQSSDNTMLSISILPTVLSNLLNIEPSWVFKIVFLIIFSLVPLGLYELYQKQWSQKVAFVSVIFFVANYVFFTGMLSDAKQMIGELFYVILFLELLTKNVTSYKSSWVILVFALFGLIVSHYSMDFIFIIIIFATWFGGKIFCKKIYTGINSSIIAFTSCLVFFWYVYIIPTVGAGPFGKFVGVIRTTIASFLSDFFQISSRGEDVQIALGVSSSHSIIHSAGTLLYDITILAILIGFISLVIISRKDRSKREYTLIVSANMALLILAIALPQFAGFLEMGRLYQILLLFLSPLFVLGCDFVFKTFSRIRKQKILKLNNVNTEASYSLVLALIVLVPFFLFQSGLIYEITNDSSPSSFSLSYYKMQDSSLLIQESDVFSAQYLSKYGNINYTPTYADTIAQTHVLQSYSTINQGLIFLLSNSTEITRADGVTPIALRDLANSYIYLRQFNVQNNKVWWYQRQGLSFNLTELPILNSTQAFVSRVYSNGYSEVYFRNS
jgi:uncharacterized membrane protein